MIFAHKIFFCDLIDDWSGYTKPDLIRFIPYTWRLSLVLKDFELLTYANEYNWIDCTYLSSGGQYANPHHNQSKIGLKVTTNENTLMAIAGDKFDMSLDLPFDELLPKTVPIKIWIQGESLEAAIHLPDSNEYRNVMMSIHESSKLSSLNPNELTDDRMHLKANNDLFPPG